MKLITYHRVELVEQLKAAYHDLQEIDKEFGEVSDRKNESILEVRYVLAQSRIDAIQKILVDGEMDY
jgi:hypothetical protein